MIALNSIHDIQVIRYAVGVSIACAISYVFATPLSFLLPVLTAALLPKMLAKLAHERDKSAGNPGLRYVRDTVFAFLIGFSFTAFFLPFLVLYIPLLAILLFYSYYHLNRGGSFWLVLCLLLYLLMMPVLSELYDGLALGVAIELMVHSLLALVVIIFTNLLIPASNIERIKDETPARVFQPGYNAVAAKAALTSTIVTLPIALMFIAEVWAGQLPVIIFVAIFTLVPDLDKSRLAAIGSITSTVIGGVIAFFIYWLLVAVPELWFVIPLMFGLSLLIGRMIFSGHKLAPFLPAAMTAVIVLINGSLGADASFTDTFTKRVLLMTLAAIYVAVMLRVVNAYWPGKPGIDSQMKPGRAGEL